MIVFERIRWQNLLSTGNQFTEINLNKSKSTLILGENGSGKSTFTEALMYVLYGRPFRDINKPQLINTITGKNLLVEIEFSINKKKYLVRRGMKPNIFEVYLNGVLQDQNSGIKDYQEYLEKNILKMNHRSFGQIVLLGSANYIPFMKLRTHERRQVIEDLLDIEIFSIMNSILKDKANQNKSKLSLLESDISHANQAIELASNYVQSLKVNNEELINSKNDLIINIQKNIVSSQTMIDDLNSKITVLLNSMPDTSKINEKKKEVLSIETDLENKKKNVCKEINFFNNHDNCPTCKRDIDLEWKEKTLEKRIIKQNKINEAISQVEKLITELNDKIAGIEKNNQKINNLNLKIQDYNADIRSWTLSISTLQKEIDDIRNNTTQIDMSEEQVKKLNNKKNSLIRDKKNLLEEKEILDISANMLKDTGIKTKIIKQYVPIINKLVNKYLASLDFFVNFELDETFNETIKSRFRDEFSYASFSEGEKAKLDLALMFTWRALSKLRNSAASNLLILDEVFDGSLDANGTSELLKIFDSLMSDTNIFVISHKGNELFDKFHSVIKFEKTSNFSKIVT